VGFPPKLTLFSRIKSPAIWPGFFAVSDLRRLFATRGNAALSNPTELINLRWIA
jgi:hypothetical protein